MKMTENDIWQEYKEYVEKYAIKHQISIEEAETHAMVHEYKRYLEERYR